MINFHCWQDTVILLQFRIIAKNKACRPFLREDSRKTMVRRDAPLREAPAGRSSQTGAMAFTGLSADISHFSFFTSVSNPKCAGGKCNVTVSPGFAFSNCATSE